MSEIKEVCTALRCDKCGTVIGYVAREPEADGPCQEHREAPAVTLPPFFPVSSSLRARATGHVCVLLPQMVELPAELDGTTRYGKPGRAHAGKADAYRRTPPTRRPAQFPYPPLSEIVVYCPSCGRRNTTGDDDDTEEAYRAQNAAARNYGRWLNKTIAAANDGDTAALRALRQQARRIRQSKQFIYRDVPQAVEPLIERWEAIEREVEKGEKSGAE